MDLVKHDKVSGLEIFLPFYFVVFKALILTLEVFEAMLHNMAVASTIFEVKEIVDTYGETQMERKRKLEEKVTTMFEGINHFTGGKKNDMPMLEKKRTCERAFQYIEDSPKYSDDRHGRRRSSTGDTQISANEHDEDIRSIMNICRDVLMLRAPSAFFSSCKGFDFAVAAFIALLPGLWMCRHPNYIIRQFFAGGLRVFWARPLWLLPVASAVSSGITVYEVSGLIRKSWALLKHVYREQVVLLYCCSTKIDQKVFRRIYHPTLYHNCAGRVTDVAETADGNITIRCKVTVGDNVVSIETLDTDVVRIMRTIMRVGLTTVRIRMQHVLLMMTIWIVLVMLWAGIAWHKWDGVITSAVAYGATIVFSLLVPWVLIINFAVQLNTTMHERTLSAIESWKDRAIRQRWMIAVDGVDSSQSAAFQINFEALVNPIDHLLSLVASQTPVMFFSVPITKGSRNAIVGVILTAAVASFKNIFKAWLDPIIEAGLHIYQVSNFETQNVSANQSI